MSLPPFTDQRRFLIILSAGGLFFFLVLALLPRSPGQNQLGTWLAVAISTANLAVALLLARMRPTVHHVLVVTSVLAITIALCDSTDGRDSDLYLLWYSWIAACGAMVRRLWEAVAHAVLISAGAVAAFAVEGDLGAAIPAVVMTVFSITATTLVVYGFGRWSQLLVDRDPLTGLANRAGLARVAQPALAAALAAGRDAVLVLLDINRFREVNDALGHSAGDRLLQAIAVQLRGVPADPAFTGRIGSDEFAVVMYGADLPAELAATHDQMRAIGRMVISQIAGPFRIDGVEVEVEASAGVAAAPLHGTSLDALLPAADAALHAAKRDGERVGVWDPGMAGVRPWELAMHAQLRAAVASGELRLHYQPLRSARTGRIAGVEALLRWAHPDRGLLAPEAFLPMAERSTLIIDVTEWVLNEALRQCADWALAGRHVPVSVNLSARMLVRDDLPSLVSQTLSAYGLPADVLTLEITESALVTQPARAAAMLRELRTRGVKLSLDDFGTGYSSMEILKALPFDEVKIDRGFVSGAHGSLPDAAIVCAVLDLGHRLGLRVVGEGVEDARALRMLMELGCDILQGEAISRPLPPSPELLALFTAAASVAGADAPVPPAAADGPGTPAGDRH
ncbi:bifunctional diguanylate cyclase/phosphodiesterase [Frankia sp. Cj5]|uniref:putative bifunctional diguanylate cyclase/phosphodiesterase n=1 Tax=Frankia sp. Cj5 TaxID=2880978 RepID=UPI001EF4ED27|nr:bifunctional diguanylate cyclase/phosphodiesterase [Frankia sp. Cj5]